MGTILYFIKEAFRGFYQAKMMTFVSIMTIAAALFFVYVMIIGLFNIESVLKKTGNQPDLAVYVKDEAAADSISLHQIMDKIKSLDQVANVKLIGKDSAWARFSKIYGEEMLDAIGENPLPVSFEIYLADHFHSSRIAQSLQREISAWSQIESVRYSREWINIVERFRWYFYAISIILGLIMLPALHFMISNTIKLTIYARKELVRNMHLVGATEFFVNMPFLLEGMLQGLIGGILCVITLIILRISLSHLPIFWGPGRLSLLIITLGVLFGWIGSISAVRKFLA